MRWRVIRRERSRAAVAWPGIFVAWRMRRKVVALRPHGPDGRWLGRLAGHGGDALGSPSLPAGVRQRLAEDGGTGWRWRGGGGTVPGGRRGVGRS